MIQITGGLPLIMAVLEARFESGKEKTEML